jgi:psiF repeat
MARYTSFIGGSASRSEVAPLSNPTGVFTMTISSRAAIAALATLLLAGTAYAQQTAAPAAKTDTMAPTDKKAAKMQTPESLECSKEADAKGLKGKERKKFRAECKKAAMDKPKQ